MGHLNRDTITAICLLIGCGIFFWASFDIRQPDYGTLMPSTWPRVIIGALAVLSLVYLVQSLGETTKTDEPTGSPEPGIRAWLTYYRNPLYCFALFFLYLVTLPVLGMLIGGVGFVFALMCALGGISPRNLLVHALLAVGTVGAMWSLFTYALGVILPSGVLFNPFG